ncbi:MAG: glycosyltransferase family 4 protein [Thermodesulfovibrionia bacterium]
MKIAIIRKKLTFLGGAESFSRNYINHLADLGHEIHVYTTKWSAIPHSNIYFHKVPVITFSSFLRDLTFAVSSFFLLKKHRKNLDIIQSHDKTLYQDIYRAGDGCHIEWLKQRWKRKNLPGKFSIVINPYHWLILILEKMIFSGHKFKKIIAGSSFVKQNIIENYHVDEKDIKIIYNGVDLQQFHPQNRDRYRAEIRKQYSIDKDDFVVLFVGSGFERKGVYFLLKAVELVPEPLTVLIVGKGNEEKFRGLIKRQKVIFCGVQKEVHKYYAAADVFLLPAIYEPFGNVYLEALASGLPVISTKQCGASEIIKNGLHGFVVERPENTDEIAERLAYLMDREVNRKMSIEARKLAESFSFEKHIEEMSALYAALDRKSHDS